MNGKTPKKAQEGRQGRTPPPRPSERKTFVRRAMAGSGGVFSDGMVETDWIEIAKSGWYAEKMPLTRAMFVDMVKEFAAQTDGIPQCVGHPWDDSPAYGWTSALEVRANGQTGPDQGASLWMRAELLPEMDAAVRRSVFKNRSIAVDRAEDGIGWRLRHVAWLGGAAPAISGLAPLKLSAAKRKGLLIYDFADPPVGAADDDEPHQSDRRDEALVYDFAATGGGATPKEEPMEGNGKPQTPPPAAPPAAGQPGPDLAAFAAQTDETKRLREEQTALKAQLAAETMRREVAEQTAFCDRLVAEGRLTPALAKGLPQALAGLSEAKETAFSFSGADGKDASATPRGFFRALLQALPQTASPLGERLTAKGKSGAGADGGQAVDFSDPSAVDAAVKAHQAANPGMNYTAAMNVVAKKGR